MFSRPIVPFAPIALLLAGTAPAGATNVDALLRLAEELEARLQAGRGPLYQQLVEVGAGAFVNGDFEDAQLIFIDSRGMPRYYVTDNVDAAETVSTDRVHPGGGAGFFLTGSTTVLGELGIWDGGAVRTSHDEFDGRAVQEDSPGGTSNHATHVSGTMIAQGQDPSAKGMSYEGQLACRDWDSDDSEMAAAAAAGMLISNHSYGFATGWRWDSGAGEWTWYGDVDVSTDEDYGFGFYHDSAQDWDQIAYDAPNYLIVASAGNDRNDFGPGPGGEHWHWEGGGWVWATDSHDADGGSTGYDTVAWVKNAKNILSVGAVGDLNGGWTQPSDVVMSSFSGWGPTDDGRIKPDLVANGVSLWSSTAGGNSSYSSYSGTSMAAPNTSGSTNLVAQYWKTTHGAPARSATLKAILFDTTSEAGAAAGPDYEFGWGLLNTEAAVQLVDDDANDPANYAHVWEATLLDGETDEYVFETTSTGPVRITICWTDPPGIPPSASLDPPDAMLVNDLDLGLQEGIARTPIAWAPWVLDPANPSAAATQGDNVRDNAEQIQVDFVAPGLHRITVTHKGTLSGGSQDYSLVSSVAVSELDPITAAPEIAAADGRLEQRITPSPFRSATTITYTLPASAEITLDLYDVGGRRVRTLERGGREAGTHQVVWDGTDSTGRPVPAGVYFSRLTARGQTVAAKLIRASR